VHCSSVQTAAQLQNGLASDLCPHSGNRELFLSLMETLCANGPQPRLAIFCTALAWLWLSRTMRTRSTRCLWPFNAVPKATVVPTMALDVCGPANDFNTCDARLHISVLPIACPSSMAYTLEPEYSATSCRIACDSNSLRFPGNPLPNTLPVLRAL